MTTLADKIEALPDIMNARIVTTHGALTAFIAANAVTLKGEFGAIIY